MHAEEWCLSASVRTVDYVPEQFRVFSVFIGNYINPINIVVIRIPVMCFLRVNNMADLARLLCSLLIIFSFLYLETSSTRYDPTWASIDSRPLPSWYDEAKLGIFVHWGVFSVPSYSSEWFWHDWQMSKLPGIVQWMQDNFKPDFTYADFAKDFSTEFFLAEQWADIFNASGAR